MVQVPDPTVSVTRKDTAAEAVALAAASAAIIRGQVVQITSGYNQVYGAHTEIKIWKTPAEKPEQSK